MNRLPSSRPAPEAGRGRLLGRARLGLRSPGALLLLVGAGVFLGTLDQTVVVTILPKIVDDLGLPAAHFGQATWIVNGYLLGYTVAMPTMGRLADAYGHVRLYLICLGIFLAGSVAAALAPDLPALVISRLGQAVGGGGLLPVAVAIAGDALPPRRRPLAIGSLAAANNASSLLGPLWGALVASAAGWRGVFWLNLVIVLPVALLLWPLLRSGAVGAAARVDWRGAALLTIGLAAGTLALTDDGADPRPLALSVAAGAVALVALGVLVRHELSSPSPLLPLDSFRKWHFSAAMGMYFLIGGALIVALVDVPLMANLLFGASALAGGLDLMRLLLLLPLGGVAGGLLCTRLGGRPVAAAGLVSAIAGFLAMRAWPAQPSSRDLWLALGLIGGGLGLCDAPIVSTVAEAVRPSERATATALLLVTWTAGMIVGLALLGTQGLSGFSARAAALFREQGTNLDINAVQRIMRQTFDATLAGACIALLLALLLAFWLERGRSAEVRWSPLTLEE